MALLTVARRVAQLPFRPLFGLFGAFILACGFTHFLDAVTFQVPVYRLSGLVKLLTAVISWTTVFALVTALPRIMAYADAGRQPLPAGFALPPSSWTEARTADYFVAVLTAGFVVFVRAVLDRFMGSDHLFVLPLLGVMFVAWRSGFGPAVVCLLLSMATIVYFFVQPRNSFVVEQSSDQLAVGLFLFCGFVASMLGESQHVANRTARKALADQRTVSAQFAESETRMRAFIDNSPAAKYVKDQLGRYVLVNQSFVTRMNRPADEILGRTDDDLYPKELASRFGMQDNTVRSSFATRTWEETFSISGKEGTYLTSKFLLPDGTVGGIDTDLTYRKQAEEALKASEGRFRHLADAMPQIVWVTTPDGQHEHFNSRWYEYTGLSVEESTGWGWVTPLHPDDKARSEAEWNRVTRTGGQYEIEYRFRRADGQYRWFLGRATPVVDESGTIVRWYGTCTDIDDQKRQAAALQESEATLRAFYDNSPLCMGVVELTADGDIRHLYDNQASCRFFGVPANATAGRRATELGTPPDVLTLWLAKYEESAAVAGPVRFAHAVGTGPDARWLSASVCPLPGGAADRPRFCYVAEDVTDARRAEAALRDSELRYRLVSNAANDAIWDWDLTANQVGWNDGVQRAFGYAPGQVDPDAGWWVDHIHPDDRGRVTHDIHAVIDGPADDWQAEYRFRRADGGYATVFDRGRVVREAGRAVRMVGSMLDLTDRLKAEQALRESEERAEFVRRASGVGFFYCDLPFDVLEWDERVKTHFHLPPDAAVTIQTFYDRIHPDDREPTRRAIAASIDDRQPYDTVYRTVHPDTGDEKVIRAIGRTSYAADGTPVRFDGVTLDVTAQRRAEEEVREAADKFQSMAESIPQLAWMTDASGYIVWYNRQWYDYTGTTLEQMEGWGWQSVHDPDELPRVVEKFKAALASGEPWEDTFPLRRHDGAYRWFLSRARPFRDTDGRIVRWFGTNTDVQDQRELEGQLRDALSDFRQLTEGLPELVWACSPSGECNYLSRQWVTYTGRPAADQMPYGWLDAVHPQDRDGTMTAWRNAVAGLAPYDVEYRLRRADGEYRWFRVRAIGLRDADGRVTRWVGTSSDMHDQKRNEQSLRDSETRFRLLTETVPTLVWNIDPTGRVTYYNRQWLDYTGVEVTDILGDGWRSALHPDDADRVIAKWAKALAEAPGRHTDEFRLRNRAGEFRWFLLAAVPLRRADGTVDQWIGAMADVDDQKREAERLEALVVARTADLRGEVAERTRAEAAVRRQGEFLDAILDNITDGIVACDAAGTLTLFNRATREFHGLPAEPLPPDRWAERFSLFRADGQTPLPPAEVPLARAFTGDRVREAEMVIAPVGRPARHMVVNGQPLFDPDGRKMGAVVSMRDVTEEKRLTARERAVAMELQRSNNELEKFAYVASHDLQEPLRKIQAFGDRLQQRTRDTLTEQGKDYLERMLSSAERMRTLINDLLSFSRVTSKSQPFVPVNLNEVVKAVVSDLEFQLQRTGGRVEVGPLPTLSGDPTQVRQLFQNLIGNGLKFHKPGVPPVVTVSAVELGAVPADSDPPPLPGSGWRISVADNGIGFEQQYAGRIFELFQRLHGRAEYEGTGIGLAVCKKIVDRHNGTISARGVPAAGATFILDWPA